MFLREVADAVTALASEVERDPSGAGVEDALKVAVAAFHDSLIGTAAAAAPPESPASPAPAAPPTVAPAAPAPPAAAEEEEAGPAEPDPDGANKCMQCGATYSAPTTCVNQHSPAETVAIADIPAASDDAAPAAGPGTPDWPAGS